jgi:hypothetical protein
MFSSVLHSSANKNAAHQPPSAPAAFASKKNAFAPPPVRHADPPAPPQRQQPEEEEQEQEQGEWAMVLYNYNSGVSGIVSAARFIFSLIRVCVNRRLEISISERISGFWSLRGLQMIGMSSLASSCCPRQRPINLLCLIGGRGSSMVKEDCSLLHM